MHLVKLGKNPFTNKKNTLKIAVFISLEILEMF